MIQTDIPIWSLNLGSILHLLRSLEEAAAFPKSGSPRRTLRRSINASRSNLPLAWLSG